MGVLEVTSVNIRQHSVTDLSNKKTEVSAGGT